MNKKFNIFTLTGFFTGAIAGLLIPSFFQATAVIGTIYINLLKLMIIPILFCSVVKALMNSPKASGIVGKSIGLFAIMFSVSYIITYLFAGLVKPGVGFVMNAEAWSGDLTNANLSDFLLSLFPSNIIQVAANNTILPVIIFAFAFGIAVNKIDLDRKLFLKNMFNSLDCAFNKMLSWVMYLTPIAVFFLMGNTTGQYGGEVLKTSFLYVGMAWLGCLIVEILVMLLPIMVVAKIKPLKYLEKVSRIWWITLSTCSSAATLPYTIKVCNEEFGVPERITNITVPLGCTIHMCGGAVSFALLAAFNSQAFGIPITFGKFVLMLVIALLINMGAPGIPGGGIVIGATYLSILGIPLDFIGIYAGIYRLLDMVYTTMNVTGDITANILIAKSEN